MTLEVSGVSFSYGEHRILDNVSAVFETGMNSIIGPNGAGKSTLVKCIAGIQRIDSGNITFDGKPMGTGESPDFSLAYMSQEQQRSGDLSVLEFMILGLVKDLGMRLTDEQIDRAYDPLVKLGLDDLAEQRMNVLSGGQRQMISVAQCLVNEPDIIILDEPTNNLDMKHNLDLFNAIRRETEEREITVIAVLHDLNFAARYSDNITVMCNGSIAAQGASEDIINPEMLRNVYGVESEILRDSQGNILVAPRTS